MPHADADSIAEAEACRLFKAKPTPEAVTTETPQGLYFTQVVLQHTLHLTLSINAYFSKRTSPKRACTCPAMIQSALCIYDGHESDNHTHTLLVHPSECIDSLMP